MTLACSRLSSRSSAPARGILEHRGFFQFTHWGSTSTGGTLRKECKTPNLCRRGGADSDKRGVKHLGQNVKVLCLSQLVMRAPEERAEQRAGAGLETRAKGRQSSHTHAAREDIRSEGTWLTVLTHSEDAGRAEDQERGNQIVQQRG